MRLDGLLAHETKACEDRPTECLLCHDLVPHRRLKAHLDETHTLADMHDAMLQQTHQLANTPATGRNEKEDAHPEAKIVKIQYGNDIRRIRASHKLTYHDFREKVLSLFNGIHPEAHLSWTDEQGDQITLAQQADLDEAFSSCNGMQKLTMMLTVPGPSPDGLASIQMSPQLCPRGLMLRLVVALLICVFAFTCGMQKSHTFPLGLPASTGTSSAIRAPSIHIETASAWVPRTTHDIKLNYLGFDKTSALYVFGDVGRAHQYLKVICYHHYLCRPGLIATCAVGIDGQQYPLVPACSGLARCSLVRLWVDALHTRQIPCRALGSVQQHPVAAAQSDVTALGPAALCGEQHGAPEHGGDRQYCN